MHFDYDCNPRVALNNIKKILEDEGFKIIEYAPEDGFYLQIIKNLIGEQVGE